MKLCKKCGSKLTNLSCPECLKRQQKLAKGKKEILKKEFPSGAYTLEKDKKTGGIKKVDFLEKLLSL